MCLSVLYWKVDSPALQSQHPGNLSGHCVHLEPYSTEQVRSWHFRVHLIKVHAMLIYISRDIHCPLVLIITLPLEPWYLGDRRPSQKKRPCRKFYSTLPDEHNLGFPGITNKKIPASVSESSQLRSRNPTWQRWGFPAVPSLDSCPSYRFHEQNVVMVLRN